MAEAGGAVPGGRDATDGAAPRALSAPPAAGRHAQERRLEDRLRLTFVELADRFGHVHPDGIHLDLPLTHELLAAMVCARRPSVSAAVARLAREGTLTRSGRRWGLRGRLSPATHGAALSDRVLYRDTASQ